MEAGADAVYFGVKGMNMRYAAANFDILEMKKVMDTLHSGGKKGYLALNVIVYENEQGKVRKILEAAGNSGVDAVILWDMAALSMAGEMGIRVHLSTQANVSSFAALKAYHALGARRVVLARECTLSDIRVLARRVAEERVGCEIEAFIHGAMCLSVSGRCFLSQYSFSRSANRGECLQPCRREYTISDVEKEHSYVIGKDYVMSPKDLCTIMFLDELIGSGIDAFKIEGRMRSPEYVRVVTSVYREAIDAFLEGKLDEAFKKDLFGRLRGTFNRGFSSGFYFGAPDDLGGSLRNEYEKTYLGEVVKFYGRLGVAEVFISGASLAKGQKILVTGKRTPAVFCEVGEMEIGHRPVDLVDKGNAVGIKVPFKVRPKDKVFLWTEKTADGR
ncbi:MAG: peptidase U32 family protein [Candidatus Omnitrophota bacterium]